MDGRVITGMVVGGIFGILFAISSVSNGEPVEIAIAGAFMLALMGGGVVIWWRDRNDSGGYEARGDQQIFKLQERLRNAVQSATYAEARGDHATAAHFRAEAATLESRLRSIGA